MARSPEPTVAEGAVAAAEASVEDAPRGFRVTLDDFDGPFDLLLSLITKKLPPTKLGERLAMTGLCVVIACNSLLAAPGHEKVAAGWVRWLVSWDCCPSEMLLLTAIHFHAGQLAQV